MIKMICALVMLSAPTDPWKDCLTPPRNTMTLGFKFGQVGGKLQAESREPADKLAQQGWIEHRLAKKPDDLQLWQEYVSLLESNDACYKPSHEKALRVVMESQKVRPQDPKLLVLRAELHGKLEQTDALQTVLAELAAKHPTYLPGLIAINEQCFRDKKYDESLKIARELAKNHPDQAEAYLHLGTRLFQEVLLRLKAMLPDYHPQAGMNVYQNLQSEYQKQLEKLADDPVRKNELEKDYATLSPLVEEALQALRQAKRVMAADSSQRWLAIEVFTCETVLEFCQSGLHGKGEPLSAIMVFTNKAKELEAFLTTAQSQHEDVFMQSAASAGLISMMVMRLRSDPVAAKEMDKLQPDISTLETFQHLAAFFKQHYSKDHATGRKLMVNLQVIARADYAPAAGLAEHTLGILSIFMEGDLKTARKHFLRALELDPQRCNSYHMYLGTCSYFEERITWEQLPAAVRERQNTAEGQVTFVKALLNSHEPDEALAMQRVMVALEHAPQHPEVLMLKATLLARLKPTATALDEAAALCEQAFTLAYQRDENPLKEPEYFLTAGAIEVLRGKSFTARRYFEDGLQVKPGEKTLQEAIDRMNGAVQVEGRGGK